MGTAPHCHIFFENAPLESISILRHQGSRRACNADRPKVGLTAHRPHAAEASSPKAFPSTGATRTGCRPAASDPVSPRCPESMKTAASRSKEVAIGMMETIDVARKTIQETAAEDKVRRWIVSVAGIQIGIIGRNIVGSRNGPTVRILPVIFGSYGFFIRYMAPRYP